MIRKILGTALIGLATGWMISQLIALGAPTFFSSEGWGRFIASLGFDGGYEKLIPTIAIIAIGGLFILKLLTKMLMRKKSFLLYLHWIICFLAMAFVAYGYCAYPRPADLLPTILLYVALGGGTLGLLIA